MRIKLYRRSSVVKNIILFLIFSLVYLHVIISLDSGVSALNLEVFLKLIWTKKHLLIFNILALVTVINARSISKVMFSIFIGIMLYEGLMVFFNNLDKLILVMNASYLIISYFFYLFWHLELKEAIYRPGFTKSMIGSKSVYDINVDVEAEFKDPVSGYLTNWNDNSCFLILTNNYENDLRNTVKVTLYFESNVFVQWGEIITSYGDGIGIKFFMNEQNEDKSLDWGDLYQIVTDRGYGSFSQV